MQLEPVTLEIMFGLKYF